MAKKKKDILRTDITKKVEDIKLKYSNKTITIRGRIQNLGFSQPTKEQYERLSKLVSTQFLEIFQGETLNPKGKYPSKFNIEMKDIIKLFYSEEVDQKEE